MQHSNQIILDALTDAMLAEEARCRKDSPEHNHELLRKLRQAVSVGDALAYQTYGGGSHYIDPHANCYSTKPCSTGCSPKL